jgi:arylformamidase
MSKKQPDAHDGAWYDAQYNTRQWVPEHMEHFRRWADESLTTVRTQPREVDVRYGGGPGEHLDIFHAAAPDAPVLFFIHGGYWRAFDKKDHSFVAPAFTRDGACVVVPNYALCPAVTIPDITMQMVRALAWTWRNIARYGGDPSRITVAGHSAGGHLATMMLACVWQAFDPKLPADLVKNALAVSALHDLDPIMRAPFLQVSVQLTPEQVHKASPARLPAPARGELFTVAGGLESEEFHRQNQLIRDAWGAERVPICEVIPGLNHFTVLEAMATPGHHVHQLAKKLLGLR